MTDRDWTAYYNAVAGKPPRETLVMALERFEAEDAGSAARPVVRIAFDLGCGEGRDTRELIRRDAATRWRVLAADPTPEGIRRTLSSIADADRSRVRTVVASLQELPGEVAQLAADDPAWFRSNARREPAVRGDAGIGPSADRVDAHRVNASLVNAHLVNASFVLPFVPPEHFARVWTWIRSIMAPGGRFTGQFFGPRDSWAGLPGRSHHAREEVLGMLDGLTLEHFQEDEKDGHDAEGNAKHWHVFHVVAKRTA
ncbi:MAG: hypothetical protein AMXMBFR58_08760 [Phycisphaerae bacterium]|nr:hypothetical protein [Phycisphaerales bacterium]